MYRDVALLRQFYHSALGRLTASTLRRVIAQTWPDFFPAETVCAGVGYAVPYLDASQRHFAVMSATQGVIHWPPDAPGRTVVTEDHILPFADSGLDRLLFVHAIENAEYLRELMADAWRVLAPNGRMLMVVPNRRGFWAGVDKTPFGHGRPYSMKQMRALLHETDFVVENHTRALYFLPSHAPPMQWLAPVFEYIGKAVMPKFGGVLLVEVTKRLYNVTPLPVRQYSPKAAQDWTPVNAS